MQRWCGFCHQGEQTRHKWSENGKMNIIIVNEKYSSCEKKSIFFLKGDQGIQPHFQNVTALVSLSDHTFWSLIGKTKLSSHGTPASVSLLLTQGSTKITCLAFVLKSCWSIGVGILPEPVHLEGRSSLFVSPLIPHRYVIIISLHHHYYHQVII